MAERFGKDQRINIWSAGCCTGEEPYTRPCSDGNNTGYLKWNISILYRPQSPVLKKAKEGIYSSWSFRETPKKCNHVISKNRNWLAYR